MNKVDVLAVMDVEIGALPNPKRPKTALREARAAVAELIDAAQGVDGVTDHASFVSDVCCCGSRMDAHNMGSGHAPVDSGTYYGNQALARLRSAIALCTGGTK